MSWKISISYLSVIYHLSNLLIYPSVHPSIYISSIDHLSVYHLSYLSVYLSIYYHLSMYLPIICLSTYLPTYIPTYISIIYLSISIFKNVHIHIISDPGHLLCISTCLSGSGFKLNMLRTEFLSSHCPSDPQTCTRKPPWVFSVCSVAQVNIT